MARGRLPIVRSILAGLLVVALGTGLGLGVGGAAARSRNRSALAAVGSTRPKALLKVRAFEQDRLDHGPLPIASAIDELAARGRHAVGAALEPHASDDLAPLQGWGMRPHDVPAWMMADAGGP
jgi:hypothetical protein